jgi:RNA polymerase-binding transcription factor DksA
MHAATARQLLVEELERLTRIRSDVAMDCELDLVDEELAHADQHPADLATELYEREKDLSMAAAVDAEMRAAHLAITKLDQGRYGTCERCGRAIPDDRLEAVPATRFCLPHELDAEGRSRLLDVADGVERLDIDRRDDRIVHDAAADLDLLDPDGDAAEGAESAEERARHEIPLGVAR